MWTTTSRALFAAAILLTQSLAQDTTTNYTSTCPGIDEPERCCPAYLDIPYISSPNASVVSTGSVSFSGPSNQDDWYLSVLVNDTGSNANNGRSRYTRESYLSVPNNTSNTSVCVYQLSPVNATKLSTGSSCAGVFSDDCVKFLEQAVSNVTNANWRPGDECPEAFFNSKVDERQLSELCGMLTPNEQEYSRERFVVPNDNCSYPSLPNIQLPSDYRTPARGSSKGFYDDKSYRSGYSSIYPASTWDQFVSQVIPFAVVTSSVEGNQNNAVQLVCITPNTTQSDAPAIVDGTPWQESAGAGSEVTTKLVMVIAALVALMLAL